MKQIKKYGFEHLKYIVRFQFKVYEINVLETVNEGMGERDLNNRIFLKN